MKFTDGQWLTRPGVTAHYAAEARSIDSLGDKLVIHAPVRPIKNRGETLQGPLLTITLSAPLPDIIRVRIEHFAGRLARGPQIPLMPSAEMAVDIDHGADFATLTTGQLTARIKKSEWGITFEAGGRVLTANGWRGTGYMQTVDRGNHIVEQLSLGVGECVYGLGERFTAFVKNGQVVEIFNKDGGTASEQAYKNVPFYLTNRGYGVLVNETSPVS
jgi:alpha-D-xyloside xylohydrolase